MVGALSAQTWLRGIAGRILRNDGLDRTTKRVANNRHDGMGPDEYCTACAGRMPLARLLMLLLLLLFVKRSRLVTRGPFPRAGGEDKCKWGGGSRSDWREDANMRRCGWRRMR